jgi:hypothetical protein
LPPQGQPSSEARERQDPAFRASLPKEKAGAASVLRVKVGEVTWRTTPAEPDPIGPGTRRETRVLIFDKWVARPRSKGLASVVCFERSAATGRRSVRPCELSTEPLGDTGPQWFFLPLVPGRPPRDRQPLPKGGAASKVEALRVPDAPRSQTGRGIHGHPGRAGPAPNGVSAPPSVWSARRRCPRADTERQRQVAWVTGSLSRRRRGSQRARRTFVAQSLRGRAAAHRTSVEAGER